MLNREQRMIDIPTSQKVFNRKDLQTEIDKLTLFNLNGFLTDNNL